MRTRGETFDLPFGNVVYLILLIIVVVGTVWYIGDIENAAGVREDFYAKEFARIINLAEPGSSVCIDATKGTHIAQDNGVSLSEMIVFDNEAHQVRVKLRAGSGTTYSWFHDVAVIEARPVLVSGGEETNRWCFQIEGGVNE